MVTPIYRFLLTTAFILATHASLANEPSLRIEFSSKNQTASGIHVELGRFIAITLIYQGPKDPGDIQLHSWTKNVHIEPRDRDIQPTTQNQIQVTESLRLYPRQSGNFTLGAIALGGAILKPFSLKVRPAQRHNIDINPHWTHHPKNTLWQGASLRVTVHQNLTDPDNEVVAEDWQIEGFDVYALPQQTHIKKNIHSVELNWILVPHNTGQFQLPPPAIQQRGRGRWRFHLPPLSLLVKPLPSYLPPTVPLGKPQLTSHQKTTSLGKYYTLTINSNSLLNKGIYGIKNSLSALSKTPHENSIETVSHTRLNLSATGVQRSTTYQTPVPTWSFAIGKAAHITVPYFDLNTGSLKHLTHALPKVWNTPKWFQNLLILSAVILAVWMVWMSLKLILAYRSNQRWINHVKSAPDLHALRKLADRKETDLVAKNIINKRCFSGSGDQEKHLNELKTRLLKSISLRL